MEHIPSVDELQRARPELGQVEFVAAGGFKAVFRATLAGRAEAVKVVYVPPEAEEGSSREEIVARVKREIDALRLCQTDRLVKLGSIELQAISIGEHDYLLYSEEFLPGDSLRDRIARGQRPNLPELLTLARCLTEAIQAIGAINHIHRDIKPGNVVATGLAGRPFVLLDLGIAFKLRGTELTVRGGGPPGTLAYMAPELLTPDYKSALDIRSDIYSAGVTVFEYAAGVHPTARRGEDALTTALRILQQPPERLANLRPDLPEPFCRMIDRCIRKLPALRFPNPQALFRAVEELR
jgi:serine/threonine protein kinase